MLNVHEHVRKKALQRVGNQMQAIHHSYIVKLYEDQDKNSKANRKKSTNENHYKYIYRHMIK